MTDLIVSADSHVLEPPDLWEERVQDRYRERAPHFERDVGGVPGEFLVCPPLRPHSPTGLGSAGIHPDEKAEFQKGGYSVCRPGSWDPDERIKDMDLDGIGIEMFYCGYSMYMFSYPADDEFQRDMHRAYNDWAAEFAARSPRRLVPIANISMTDPDADLAELHRIKQLGFRGIFISNDPAPHRRYHEPIWDPFWSAVEELELPVSIHILTKQAGWEPARDKHPMGPVNGTLIIVPAFRTIAEMIITGVLARHPRLNLVSVENDIGWIPSFLKRLDWYTYRHSDDYRHLSLRPSEYWRRQVYATFQDDEPGVRLRDLIGVDRLMWGSDYPHFDSTWPHSRRVIERNFAGAPEAEVELIVSGNARRLYQLDDLVG